MEASVQGEGSIGAKTEHKWPLLLRREAGTQAGEAGGQGSRVNHRCYAGTSDTDRECMCVARRMTCSTANHESRRLSKTCNLGVPQRPSTILPRTPCNA